VNAASANVASKARLTWDVKKLMERDMVSAFASKKDFEQKPS
jgi:hypothetical protein